MTLRAEAAWVYSIAGEASGTLRDHGQPATTEPKCRPDTPLHRHYSI
jgi:hypothetical protein